MFKTVANTRQMVPGKKAKKQPKPEPNKIFQNYSETISEMAHFADAFCSHRSITSHRIKKFAQILVPSGCCQLSKPSHPGAFNCEKSWLLCC